MNLDVPPGAKVIDAKWKLVLPGGIDPHTHLEQSVGSFCTADDFYSGTCAAVAGGTTTISVHLPFILFTIRYTSNLLFIYFIHLRLLGLANVEI